MNVLDRRESVAPALAIETRPRRLRFMTRPRRPWCAAVMLPVVGCLWAVGCREDVPKRAEASPATSSAPDAPNQRAAVNGKVLLVHSYHPEYEWVASITRGVKRALVGTDAELQIFYMDTKRDTREEWKEQRGQVAARIVAEWQPDVVIAADDNAQQYFARHLAGQPRPQVAFCGVNAEPDAYGYPASNITGILERPHWAVSLSLLKGLVPRVQRIAIITDDSETSAGALEFIKKQQTDFTVVSTDTPSTFRGWQAAVHRAETTADAIAVYVYHTVRSEEGKESMVPKEVMGWTVENSSIPIVGFFIFAVDDGVLCGYLESGAEHGFRAGLMAIEMLRGKTAADLPMVTALEGQSMLNMKTARRLGIDVPDDVRKRVDIVIDD